MWTRVLSVGSASVVLAAIAACSSFSSDTPDAAAPPEAGADTSVPSCPGGPTLVDVTTQPDARCGPGGAIVDLSTHDHCGACGHACAAGTCVGGSCEPASLLSGESLAIARVVGTTAYYVTTNGQVGRAEIITALKGKLFTSSFLLGSAAVARRLQVEPPWLYVSTTKEPQRFKLDDTGDEALRVATTELGGFVAATPTGYFYASPSGVEKHVPSGELSVVSAGTTKIVAEGEDAYWITYRDAGISVRGPFPSAEPPVTQAATSAVALAVDATHIYLADAAARLIRRVARGGGALQSVASEPSERISDLAIDGDYVYWTAQHGVADGWVVVRVAKCGGLPLVLAKNLAGAPTPLSFDTTYVYTTAAGRLIRVAK